MQGSAGFSVLQVLQGSVFRVLQGSGVAGFCSVQSFAVVRVLQCLGYCSSETERALKSSVLK